MSDIIRPGDYQSQALRAYADNAALLAAKAVQELLIKRIQDLQSQLSTIVSSESVAILGNGVVSGLTKTFTVNHSFNSKDVVVLGVYNLNGTKIQDDNYSCAVFADRVKIIFTGLTSLPSDGSLRAFLKKVG